jgi:hypothetical protein
MMRRLGESDRGRMGKGAGLAYNDNAFAPSTGPLSADEADPVALAEHAWSDGDAGVEFDAHPEIELECRWWDLKRAGDVVLVETVEEVVGWDGLLDDVLICLAFKQVLALAGCVLGSNLVAVYTLYREAFVFFFGSELDEGVMNIVEWWRW